MVIRCYYCGAVVADGPLTRSVTAFCADCVAENRRRMERRFGVRELLGIDREVFDLDGDLDPDVAFVLDVADRP